MFLCTNCYIYTLLSICFIVFDLFLCISGLNSPWIPPKQIPLCLEIYLVMLTLAICAYACRTKRTSGSFMKLKKKDIIFFSFLWPDLLKQKCLSEKGEVKITKIPQHPRLKVLSMNFWYALLCQKRKYVQITVEKLPCKQDRVFHQTGLYPRSIYNGHSAKPETAHQKS